MKNFIFAFLFCALSAVPSFAANITLTCEITNCEEVKEIYYTNLKVLVFQKLKLLKKVRMGNLNLNCQKAILNFIT